MQIHVTWKKLWLHLKAEIFTGFSSSASASLMIPVFSHLIIAFAYVLPSWLIVGPKKRGNQNNISSGLCAALLLYSFACFFYPLKKHTCDSMQILKWRCKMQVLPVFAGSMWFFSGNMWPNLCILLLQHIILFMLWRKCSFGICGMVIAAVRPFFYLKESTLLKFSVTES